MILIFLGTQLAINYGLNIFLDQFTNEDVVGNITLGYQGWAYQNNVGFFRITTV